MLFFNAVDELRSYFLGKTGDVSGRDKAKDLANTYSEKYRVCLEFESKKNKQGISESNETFDVTIHQIFN